MKRIYVFLIAVITVCNAGAQDWTKIWGPTEFVIVDGETGLVYAKPIVKSTALNPEIADIFRWDGEPDKWTPLGMPGKKYVTAGRSPQSALFCLDFKGIVYRFKGTPKDWESLGAPENGKAFDIFGGPDGLLAVAESASKDVYRWESHKGWTRIGGPGKEFVIGKNSDEEFPLVYGLSPENSDPAERGVYQWSGSWHKRGGPAGNIYISRSTLFATNPGTGDLMAELKGKWEKIGGPGQMFATDQLGKIYGLSADKKAVYKWTGKPNKWKEIGGAADKIFAGGDGLLFATNPDTKDLMFYNH